MNYLVSVLFVLAYINFTTQDNSSTIVNKTFNDSTYINGKPIHTAEVIPIEPNMSTTIHPPTTISPNITTINPNITTTINPNSTTTKPTPTTEPTPTTKSTTPTTKPTATTKPTSTSAPTTTAAPITPHPSPNSTTVKPPTSSVSPVTTEKPEPEPHRRFDGPSFIGGIVLALGLVAIGFVAFKFYKARLEVNYHTL